MVPTILSLLRKPCCSWLMFFSIYCSLGEMEFLYSCFLLTSSIFYFRAFKSMSKVLSMAIPSLAGLSLLLSSELMMVCSSNMFCLSSSILSVVFFCSSRLPAF